MEGSVSKEFVFKFIIIGNSGVGKTSILHYFVYNNFNRQSKQTVNVEFSSRALEIGDNKVKLQLWDTAGQEKFIAVTKSYYRNALGVIIVFDITKSDSFQHASKWLENAKTSAHKNATIFLVGNKKDLKDERVISFTEAARFCQDNDMHYYECSAFLGEGIEEIFKSASKNIISKIVEGKIVLDENKGFTNTAIVIEPNKNKNNNYTGCSC